jgi:hypothetical protein
LTAVVAVVVHVVVVVVVDESVVAQRQTMVMVVVVAPSAAAVVVMALGSLSEQQWSATAVGLWVAGSCELAAPAVWRSRRLLRLLRQSLRRMQRRPMLQQTRRSLVPVSSTASISERRWRPVSLAVHFAPNGRRWFDRMAAAVAATAD